MPKKLYGKANPKTRDDQSSGRDDGQTSIWVTLIANAFVPEGATDAEIDAAYDEALVRLDRMAADQRRLARDMNVLLESVSLFLSFQFSLTAQIPEPDAAARAIGRERFQKFIDQVGRRIAGTETSDMLTVQEDAA